MKNQELQILHKSNLLIQAKYNLSLVENRVFTTLLYNFQKNEKGIYTCEIHKDIFLDLIKYKSEKNIKGISKILASLNHKNIIIKEHGKNNNFTHNYTLIGGYSLNEDNETFTIESLPKIYDLLRDYYQVGYTPINLMVILGLNNFYAQRFYELLRLWSGVKTIINYSINELKELLQVQDVKSYNNYTNFKINVIKKGIDELNESKLWDITFKEIREGRRIVSINFTVKDLESRTYVKNSTNNTVIETIVEPPIEPTFDKSTLEVNIEEPITPPPIVETINLNEVDENACAYEILDLEEMSSAVRKRFIKDFKSYNFNLKCLQDSFDDALMITLEKDNVEVLGSSQYKHFKSTLIYKANDFIKQDMEKLEDKLEAMHHDTFSKPDLTDVEKQTIKIKCSNKIEQLEKMQNLVEKDAESIRK